MQQGRRSPVVGRGSQDRRSSLSESPCAGLVEREVATSCLREQLEFLLAGQSASLFVLGAAGLGKTALLDWLEGLARRSGLSLSRAVASPMERGLPFGLADQALRGLGEDGCIAAPSTGPVVGDARLARFTRTLRFVEKSSSAAPLVLMLDDLHWADADSVDLVGFLCRRLAGLPVLVVGAMRPEPALGSILATDLASTRHARLVHLDPLSREGSDALLSRLLGRPPDSSTSERLWRLCAGSPLLLEAAAALEDREARRGPPYATQSPSLILERFADIGELSRGYVEAAAVLGVRFRPRDGASLAGLDDPDLADAHGRLLRSRLLEDLEPGWSRFVHPLFAQAVLDALPGPRRERLHEQAFRLLVAHRAPDALAAEHAVAAGLAGDPLAIEVVWRAGREALSRGALASAETHLANAVGLAGERAPDDLLLDHLRALAARARPAQATRACLLVLGRSTLSASARAETLRLLARTKAVQAEPREVERNYEAAIAVLGHDHREQAAEILFDGILTGLASSPVTWVAKMSAQALKVATPGTALRERLELIGCHVALIGGDASGAATILGAAARADLHEEGAGQSWTWAVSVHLVNALKVLEAFEEAGLLFEREYRRASEAEAPWMLHALSIAYADALHRLGRVEEALELVCRTTELAEHTMRPWNDLAMAVLLTELGRDREAEDHLAFLRGYLAAMPEDCNAPVRLWLGLLDARELLRRGEAVAASDRMAGVEATASLTGFREPCIVPWADVAIEAHVAAGAIGAAEWVLSDLEGRAALLPCRWPGAAALLGRARLAAAESLAGDGTPGRPGARGTDAVNRLFERALEAFGALPLPIARAEALLAYGRHLRRSGRVVQARQVLRTALSLAESAASERLARVARDELGAAGGRRRRHDGDPIALTAQEERVGALASEGLTNAQIAAALYVSPKTVEHHLAKIFAKLGLGSRRELMREWPVRPR